MTIFSEEGVTFHLLTKSKGNNWKIPLPKAKILLVQFVYTRRILIFILNEVTNHLLHSREVKVGMGYLANSIALLSLTR